MMLDRPRRLTLVAAPKPESKAPGNVDDEGKARRFRDAALPHLDDVYTLARHMLRNAADAEDVVQDACMKAYAGLAVIVSDNDTILLLRINKDLVFTEILYAHFITQDE